jgi:hypothetical protein
MAEGPSFRVECAKNPMKTIALKAIATFFILLVATSVMMDVFHTSFGNVDFFQKHGIFFLIFITIFPRLTLLFSSVVTGGFFWWLGFIFCPRILVASLATVSYFHTNPVLVILSWLIALGGETMEKAGLGKRPRFVFRTFRAGPSYHQEARNDERPSKPVIDNGDVIEAEFTKKN